VSTDNIFARRRFVGRLSGKLIDFAAGEASSNVVSVHFTPIDQSGAMYAIALATSSVRREIRKQRKQARQRAAGGAS
jgi:hypothetical protein